MLDSYCVKLLYNFSLMLYMCSQVEWGVGVFARVSFCLFTGRYKTLCRNGCVDVCVCVSMSIWMRVRGTKHDTRHTNSLCQLIETSKNRV